MIVLYAFLSALVVQIVGYTICITCFKGEGDKYYDLFGALGFFIQLVIMYVFKIVDDIEILPFQIMVSAFVVIWFLRLGSFLVYRVHKVGKDSRFDEIKIDYGKFLVAFILQALWNIIILLPVVLLLEQKDVEEFTDISFPIFVLGVVLYSFGITIETVSDLQKLKFKLNPENKGKFITKGLWKYNRHPNYLGEFMIWIGITTICMTLYDSEWKYFAVFSPIFLVVLICFVSGINKLEESADKKWGELPEYKQYKKQAGVIFFNFKAIFCSPPQVLEEKLNTENNNVTATNITANQITANNLVTQ